MSSMVAFAAQLVLLFVGHARALETCFVCHSNARNPMVREPTLELPGSVHGEVGLACSDCHGGRPDELTARAHDARAGYRSRAQADAQPSLCGSCHAENSSLRRFVPDRAPDAPVNELALYNDSVHGRAFAGGNPLAPSCPDCHGHHDVLRVSDENSRINPRHVAQTCGRCHTDANRMDRVGLPHDQQRQWLRSAHGKAHAEWVKNLDGLKDLEGRRPNERHPPTCNDCHSEHSNARASQVDDGCQHCHEQEAASVAAGPHGEEFRRKGFLPCAECHGSHEVAEVESSLIGLEAGAACTRCHEEEQRMADVILQMATTQQEADEALDRADRALNAARDAGTAPGNAAALRRSIAGARKQLRLVVHGLDAEQIRGASDAAKEAARSVLRSVQELDESPASGNGLRRALWTISAVIAAFLIVLFLHLAWVRRRG